MLSGWQYRLRSVGGVAVITALAVAVANSVVVHALLTRLPVVGRLAVDAPMGAELVFEMATTVVIVTGAFLPLYKPRPRRILDTVALTQKRVLVAVLTLAAIGYFDYTYRLPRATLIAVTPLLLVMLPAWFVWIRRRPNGDAERAIIVGDDPDAIDKLAADVEIPFIGYLCPTSAFLSNRSSKPVAAVADGGAQLSGLGRLGGLSRIEDVLVEYDVDTAVLAFEHTDRAEFFGALDACYEHGVDVLVHRDHADRVLTADTDMGTLVSVDVEPWDIQDHMLKRGFDVMFSVVGLVVLSPVICGIALAIKLDDGGPILYSQERTAVFGETFEVFKFRTMVPEGESVEPVADEVNDRITRVGRVLRQTHLDEIPQLWSILVGNMSVVGPRAVWTEEESLLEAQEQSWRKRWFVKPGLTGLAQVNGAKSTDPEEKLRFDLQYVKHQSFTYDLKLVVRQIWKVGLDVVAVLR
ncbi:exopolysaccharide biosynthesis polyprenyl glycosylphosphotransferase [Halorubrum sp. Ea1]|uniref:sugar transferase n=1 Tax=Halorubrum sp. Ea1 TaxID=1480718 RepID=UPI000B98286A|nr:sugar transferase [Halorubrum sp. Ea1]OYR49687.1 exopolysaccharide biosynthesis polyprenyl glycosylphosphotransferase [Halorubrum sp. Ea1]